MRGVDVELAIVVGATARPDAGEWAEAQSLIREPLRRARFGADVVCEDIELRLVDRRDSTSIQGVGIVTPL